MNDAVATDELHGDVTSLPGVINNQPLSQRLRLVAESADTFIGHPIVGFEQRVFGGHLLGQATLAAAATVEDQRRVPVSLHCYFVSAGNAAEPLHYNVTRVRDGRSFSVRTVTVTQGGSTLMTFEALFNEAASGPSEVQAEPAPVVPGPDELTPVRELPDNPTARPYGLKYAPRAQWWTGSRPFDIRFVDQAQSTRRFWFRTPPEATTDRRMMRAVLACASDRSLSSAIIAARNDSEPGRVYNTASLDHALWLHRDAQIGEWLLYQQDSPFSARGTGIARGLIFNQNGELVATLVQQALLT